MVEILPLFALYGRSVTGKLLK